VKGEMRGGSGATLDLHDTTIWKDLKSPDFRSFQIVVSSDHAQAETNTKRKLHNSMMKCIPPLFLRRRDMRQPPWGDALFAERAGFDVHAAVPIRSGCTEWSKLNS